MTLSSAARELLLDSEATLRLAGAAAADAAGHPVSCRLEALRAEIGQSPATTMQSDLVMRVCGEIESIMSRLRERRDAAPLDPTAVLTEIEARLDQLTQMLDPQARES